LDRLYLWHSAAIAWSAYLKLDGTSGWANQARRRQAALERPSAPERWQSALADLATAMPKAFDLVARKLVQASPQMTREFALEDAMGNWADQIVAGDKETAKRYSRIAAALGQALQGITGDRTVSAAAAAVDATSGSPSQAPDLELARAHQAYRGAMRAFRRLATEEAGTLFAAAESGFHHARSPVELWAAAGRARVLAFDSQYDVASRTFRSVLAVAERESFLSLAGWCHWGLGWIASRQGEYAEATREFQGAEAAYGTTGESENLAAMTSFLGENLASQGQASEAWNFRLRALAALSECPISLRRHVALMDATYWAMRKDARFAALALQRENLQAAEKSRDPVRRAESRWALSRILLKLGRYSQARSALGQAFEFARQAPAGSPRKKLLADLWLAQGEVLLQLKPGSALGPLSQAVATYRELEIPLSYSYALFGRAKFFLSTGREREAEEDLATALATFESLSQKIEDTDLQSSYAESIQDIYDEMIRLQWVLHGSQLGTLSAIERARSLGRAGISSRSVLPQRATLEYALLKDRLIIWFIASGQAQVFERKIGQAEVENLVERFLAEIQQRQESAELKSLSSALYELLIPAPAQTVVTGRTLYLIPDKVLNRLPFAALFDQRRGRFLLQESPLVSVPSLAQRGPGGDEPQITGGPRALSALLVANPAIDRSLYPSLPDLPGAEIELATAQPSFGGSLLLKREEATRDRILENLDRFDVFVFAGHAINDASHPSLSSLAVAPSAVQADLGVLSAQELSGRSFRKLRLVVLSACTSVGPQSARFSGLVGLARPFLEAGVKAVVGTLWPVDDRETGDLLRSFYGRVGRLPAAVALRRTQLQQIVDHPADAWRNMFLWANFVYLESASADAGQEI
jgi:CHAT domain-containing protein